MKIAACLIVKDSAETIEACIASIRPFVDEINVYDTGSTDDTIAKLRELNEEPSWLVEKATGRIIRPADPDYRLSIDKDPTVRETEEFVYLPLAPIRIEHGEWREDFSWARTQSFAMASDDVEWLLWLDDDDQIENAHNLRQFVLSAPPEVDGFVCVYDYARDEHGTCICELWRERLMRRSAGYTWHGAVHEVLIPPDGHPPALVRLERDQLRYIHNRPADRYDPERNLKILLAQKEKVEADGELVEPRTLAYIGTELLAKQQFIDAMPYFHAYLERPDTGWSDERVQVAHKLALCLRIAGNPKAAVEVEFNALKERDDWGETAVGLCESFTALGDYARAERWAKRALELGQPQSMLILNPLEFTFVPLVRLAEACAAQARFEEAQGYLQQAGQYAPQHPLLTERNGLYEQAKLDHALVVSVLTLRENLIRYDENLKAYWVMENLPYRIADDPVIVKARADTREMCKHYLEPHEYLRWYEDDPKESTLTDDHIDMVGEAFGRVGGLLEGLNEQQTELGYPPRLLDLGCNDWWMGEFFARQGFRCDGVELNKRSHEKAIERAERFDRDVTIVQGDLHDARRLLEDTLGSHFEQYDAVSLFEVLEHVPDPEATLDLIESLLLPGGRIYISTPDGAFEHGQLPNWAKVERKGHLRAIPIQELADMLNQRGRVEQLHQTDGDRVAFASYTPMSKKSKIVFYGGGAWEPWSPASINQGGLGGSETALVQVSARLAAEGHEVKVYSGAEPGLYLGALWRPFTAWDPNEECDLLIVSRSPSVFDNPIGAKRTALWCHDHSYPGVLTEDRAAKIDTVVVLSEWQRERFARLYPYLAGKLEVIRNGITIGSRWPQADNSFEERKPVCVYSSSADRGLDVMLKVWPEIRKHVPDAELHVFYGFNVLDRIALHQPELFALKASLLKKVEDLGGEQAGIMLRGRVGQRELAAAMQEARVLTYPTAFLETSCITGMEARAAGLPIVTSELGALSETVGSHGQLLSWAVSDDGVAEDVRHNESPEYQSWFVREVTRLLTDREHWEAWHRRALAGVDELDWQARIPEWEALVPSEVREAVAA